MNQEIADNSRACCNCANATMSYPNCSCWQHKYCNGDRPYVIPKEAWIKTAEECEEFEMGTCQEADVYLELHRIMSEESKDKNPKPEPTCKSCGFYENNCPFIRGKFIPYPNKVCKDYTYSVMQEQSDGTFTSYDMAKTFTEGQHYVMEHPEKFGLCKPAEWSEEDEKMFNRIIDTVQDSVAECDCDDTGCKARFALEEEANWLRNRLKSLRPQLHWKPSEVQMDALAWYSGNSGVPPTGDKAIKSLYNDLQKLL